MDTLQITAEETQRREAIRVQIMTSFMSHSEIQGVLDMLTEAIEINERDGDTAMPGLLDRQRFIMETYQRKLDKHAGASNIPTAPDVQERERPTGSKKSGTVGGPGTDHKMASDRQKEFLADLLHGRTDEIAVKAQERIDSVRGHINFETASNLIEKLMEAAPGVVAWKERMSGKQRDLLIKLWVERGVNENTAAVVMTKTWLKTTKDQASKMIDRAFAAGKKQTATVKAKAEEGFYEVGDKVIKVQRGVTSGNLFAKLLVVDPELAKGFEWVYTPGLITETIGAKALTKERAAQLGQDLKLYGYCFKCGRELTDETSIERGIGRICWEKI